jgi:hypothetical protein
MAFLDGSFAPAKKGGKKVGVTKKGKGSQWMVVVDGHGLAVGLSPRQRQHGRGQTG